MPNVLSQINELVRTDPAAFASLCNRLADYGTRARQHYSGDSYYQEHFEIILKERVLASLKLIG